MSKHDHDPFIADFHARLKMIREIESGDSQQAFADKIGIELKRWNNFECGYPLPREVGVILVKQLQGMSFDWILFGWDKNLSVEWRRKIAAAERKANPPPTKPKGSPKGQRRR